MTTAVSAPTSTRPPTGVGKRRALTVVAAALAPTAVWLLAQASGTELRVTLANQPSMVVSLPFVVGTALAASLAGWGASAVLQRTTSHARTLWTGLVVAALLASFGPVAIVETNSGARALLALMHVTVATVMILGVRGTVHARRSANAGRNQS